MKNCEWLMREIEWERERESGRGDGEHITNNCNQIPDVLIPKYGLGSPFPPSPVAFWWHHFCCYLSILLGVACAVDVNCCYWYGFNQRNYLVRWWWWWYWGRRTRKIRGVTHLRCEENYLGVAVKLSTSFQLKGTNSTTVAVSLFLWPWPWRYSVQLRLDCMHEPG